MNILFTGSTVKQVDEKANSRAKIKRIDDSSIICNSLKKQGHIVTRKLIEINEDISKYDLIIVGIGAFGTPNYKYIFNAMHLINRADNVILFHEDWKIKETMSSYNLVANDFSRVQRYRNKKWSNGLYIYSNTEDDFSNEDIHNAVKDIVEGKYKYIIPAFNWGDKSIVSDVLQTDVSNINNVDLTPYVLDYYNIKQENVDHSKKSIKYMLAALGNKEDYVRKLKLYHDVDYYGTSNKNAIILDDEYSVYKKMQEYWGVIVPKYNSAGSGWFRIRYIYSALNKNVLIMPRQDSNALGLDYYEKIEPWAEKEDLLEIAEQQSVSILKHLTTIEQFDEKLNKIIGGK